MAEAWQEVDGVLYKKFVFANFAEAFGFMTRVAAIAEAQIITPIGRTRGM